MKRKRNLPASWPAAEYIEAMKLAAKLGGRTRKGGYPRKLLAQSLLATAYQTGRRISELAPMYRSVADCTELQNMVNKICAGG